METLKLKTQYKTEMIDITKQIKDAVIKAGIKDGLCSIFIPHTTASVMLFENVDPNLRRDILAELSTWAPSDKAYFHKGENGHAHLKSALSGASVSVPVRDGQPLFGQWQGLFFLEFDGPRDLREVHVTVING
jgi:secondary thiamine-phosphate synthase enzyme